MSVTPDNRFTFPKQIGQQKNRSPSLCPPFVAAFYHLKKLKYITLILLKVDKRICYDLGHTLCVIFYKTALKGLVSEPINEKSVFIKKIKLV